MIASAYNRWSVEVLVHVNMTIDVEAETPEAACKKAVALATAAVLEAPMVDDEDIAFAEANNWEPSTLGADK